MAYVTSFSSVTRAKELVFKLSVMRTHSYIYILSLCVYQSVCYSMRVFLCLYICLPVYIYVHMYVYTYERIRVCVYVCMYVSKYVCICLSVCLLTYPWICLSVRLTNLNMTALVRPWTRFVYFVAFVYLLSPRFCLRNGWCWRCLEARLGRYYTIDQ